MKELHNSQKAQIDTHDYKKLGVLLEKIDDIIFEIHQKMILKASIPFYDDRTIEDKYWVTNIEFPLPEEYILEFQNLLQEKLNALNEIEYRQYEVDIKMMEYCNKNDHVVKKVNSYIATISYKIKEKTVYK